MLEYLGMVNENIVSGKASESAPLPGKKTAAGRDCPQ
jgi:hypothetical protein